MGNRAAIIEVLNRYCDACDERRFELLDDVFTPEARGLYGSAPPAEGRDAIVAVLRENLEGCGPSQHLIGNHRIAIDCDTATSRTKVRAFKIGGGEQSHLTFEVFGEYEDQWIRTPHGWRIASRRLAVALHAIRADAHTARVPQQGSKRI